MIIIKHTEVIYSLHDKNPTYLSSWQESRQGDYDPQEKEGGEDGRHKDPMLISNQQVMGGDNHHFVIEVFHCQHLLIHMVSVATSLKHIQSYIIYCFRIRYCGLEIVQWFIDTYQVGWINWKSSTWSGSPPSCWPNTGFIAISFLVLNGTNLADIVETLSATVYFVQCWVVKNIFFSINTNITFIRLLGILF